MNKKILTMITFSMIAPTLQQQKNAFSLIAPTCRPQVIMEKSLNLITEASKSKEGLTQALQYNFNDLVKYKTSAGTLRHLSEYKGQEEKNLLTQMGKNIGVDPKMVYKMLRPSLFVEPFQDSKIEEFWHTFVEWHLLLRIGLRTFLASDVKTLETVLDEFYTTTLKKDRADLSIMVSVPKGGFLEAYQQVYKDEHFNKFAEIVKKYSEHITSDSAKTVIKTLLKNNDLLNQINKNIDLRTLPAELKASIEEKRFLVSEPVRYLEDILNRKNVIFSHLADLMEKDVTCLGYGSEMHKADIVDIAIVLQARSLLEKGLLNQPIELYEAMLDLLPSEAGDNKKLQEALTTINGIILNDKEAKLYEARQNVELARVRFNKIQHEENIFSHQSVTEVFAQSNETQIADESTAEYSMVTSSNNNEKDLNVCVIEMKERSTEWRVELLKRILVLNNINIQDGQLKNIITNIHNIFNKVSEGLNLAEAIKTIQYDLILPEAIDTKEFRVELQHKLLQENKQYLSDILNSCGIYNHWIEQLKIISEDKINAFISKWPIKNRNELVEQLNLLFDQNSKESDFFPIDVNK